MGELTLTNLFESQTIFADHKDLIHDVAYDFYGERMATCSSDQYVKVGYDVNNDFIVNIALYTRKYSYLLNSLLCGPTVRTYVY